MTREEELNRECAKCMAEAAKNFETIDPVYCATCPVGREIHQLEVDSGSSWNKVDWNRHDFEDLYHH